MNPASVKAATSRNLRPVRPLTMQRLLPFPCAVAAALQRGSREFFTERGPSGTPEGHFVTPALRAALATGRSGAGERGLWRRRPCPGIDTELLGDAQHAEKALHTRRGRDGGGGVTRRPRPSHRIHQRPSERSWLRGVGH